MELRPLGNRILIRPDAPAKESDLIEIPEVAQRHLEMTGEVIALGTGPLHDSRLKAQIMADVRGIIAECVETFRMDGMAFTNMLQDEIGRYGCFVPHEYEVKVGDRVVFPWSAGVKVQWDGEDLILLTEDDPVAIIEEEQAA